MSKVKIDLVTGFLGAGKTTFILRLLPHLEQKGIRAAVVENDFARSGTDSALLQAAGAQVCELAGGCICCGLKANFHDLLLSLAESGAYDRIIVEPSGIFDPKDFFQVAQSPRISQWAKVGAVAAVVDPGMLRKAEGRSGELLRAQLAAATVITAGRPVQQEAFVRAVADFMEAGHYPAPDCPIVAAPHEDSDFYPHFLAMEGKMPRRLAEAFDHQAAYRVTALRLQNPVDPQALRIALGQLLSGAYGNVLRVKGTVPGGEGMLLVNAAADAIDICPAPDAEAATLNIIGNGLDRAGIRKLLQNAEV